MGPADFLQRTLTGFGADWPFPYTELVRWYDYNDTIAGISGEPYRLPNGAPAYPDRKYSLLPQPGANRTRSTSLFQTAAEKLGWRYMFGGERTVISVPFKGRDPKNFRQASRCGALAGGDQERRGPEAAVDRSRHHGHQAAYR